MTIITPETSGKTYIENLAETAFKQKEIQEKKRKEEDEAIKKAMEKVRPAPGYAFIREETLQSRGVIDIGDKTINSVGVIHSVQNEEGGFLYEILFRHFSREKGMRYKVGDKVIFSQYLSEDKYIEDENGKQIKDIRLLPIHAIQALCLN